jgi:hypothetical protein
MYNSVPFTLDGVITDRVSLDKLNPVARAFAELTLKHTQFERALDALADVHSMSGIHGCGIVVEGKSGLGKTTVLNTYVRDVYARPCYAPTDELTPLPVLKIRIPGRPTIPRVIEKLLLTSNQLYVGSKKSQSLEFKLHQLITQQHVEMIIFDEYQHLLRKNAEIRTNDTINFLKVLADDYQLAVVFAGLPDGREILNNFPELNSRMSYQSVVFTEFNIDSPKAVEEYTRYIIGIQDMLKRHGVDICLKDREMLLRILVATEGIPRFIYRLFMRIFLKIQHQKAITIEHFKAAQQSFPESVLLGLFDPFSAPIASVEDKYKEIRAAQTGKLTSKKGKK